MTIRSSWADRLTGGSLALWGVVHVVGGASLVSMTASEGLGSLGPNATTPPPADVGEAATALLHFHGFDVAVAGVAVLALAILWWRGGGAWQLTVALGLALALDVGLVLYLVGPGLMPLSDGLPGPALLVVAVAPLAVKAWRRQVPTPA